MEEVIDEIHWKTSNSYNQTFLFMKITLYSELETDQNQVIDLLAEHNDKQLVYSLVLSKNGYDISKIVIIGQKTKTIVISAQSRPHNIIRNIQKSFDTHYKLTRVK